MRLQAGRSSSFEIVLPNLLTYFLLLIICLNLKFYTKDPSLYK